MCICQVSSCLFASPVLAMVGRPTVWKDSEDEISQLMLDLVPVQEGRMFDYLLRKSDEMDLERMKPFLAFLLALQ